MTDDTNELPAPYPMRSGARILALDDGGVRVLSSLLILKNLMRRVGHNVYPYQYFDLIVGTGWGGLFALMLGRLKMPVDDCIEVLKKNLSDIAKISYFHSIIRRYTGKPKYDQGPLRDLIHKLLENKEISEDEVLAASPEDQQCRTMVIVVNKQSIGRAVRLRSYPSRRDTEDDDVAIWEVACAAIAYPLDYPAVQMGQYRAEYIAASFGFSNPAEEALDEAVRIWNVSGIQCLVSLGAGSRDSISLSWNACNILAVVDAVSRLAIDTESAHGSTFRAYNILGILYFRLNVSRGMTRIGYHDVLKLKYIDTYTEDYLHLEETKRELRFITSHLIEARTDNNATMHPTMDANIPRNDGPSSSHAVSAVLSEGNANLSRPSGSSHPWPQPNPAQQDLISVGYSRMESGSLFDMTFTPGTTSVRAAEAWFKKLARDVQPILMKFRQEKEDRLIKVAVLDSGLDRSHPLIQERVNLHKSQIRECRDWTNSEFDEGISDGNMTDQVGHGTSVCDVLLRVARVSLYVGKITTSEALDDMTVGRVTNAISYAAREDKWNADIIILALGFEDTHHILENLIRGISNRRKIILAAVSNNGDLDPEKRVSFPACLQGHVISIRSVNGYGTRAKSSPTPTDSEDGFAILGEGVEVAWPHHLVKSGMQVMSGSSYATPIAGGIAAMLLEFSIQETYYGANSSDKTRKTLWDYRGIRQMFEFMSTDQKRRVNTDCRVICPWKLFNRRYDDIRGEIDYQMGLV